MRIKIGLETKKMVYFQACMLLQTILNQEEYNKYRSQHNLLKLDNKIRIKKLQDLTKKVEIQVG